MFPVHNMTHIKSNCVIIAIFFFVVFTIISHIPAPPEYSLTRDGLSILAAQAYKWKIIMQFGFISMGIIVIILKLQLLKDYLGLVQRILFLISFIWLVNTYVSEKRNT